MIEVGIKENIRNVNNFPKKGINFKDITPILLNPNLCKDITEEFCNRVNHIKIDAVAGIESRGFLFGMQIAAQLQVPFIPIRKKGKLPYEKISQQYTLEYDTAELEVHKDAIKSGWHVLVHDDLLATGGTAKASAELIQQLNGTVAGFSFIIELSFLKGKETLSKYSDICHTLATYSE